jgi:hypothetical protein
MVKRDSWRCPSPSYEHAFETLPAVPVSIRRPARVAVMLALAHKIQNAIDRGVVRDCADVAMRLGLSRARISQLLDLTLLAPDIQERLLELTSTDGVEPIGEQTLRWLTRTTYWTQQRLRRRTTHLGVSPVQDRPKAL